MLYPLRSYVKLFVTMGLICIYFAMILVLLIVMMATAMQLLFLYFLFFIIEFFT